MLDEVEERLLGPVDVLEAQHERLRLGEARRPFVRRPGDLLATPVARDRVEHARGEPEQVCDRVARARLAKLLDRLLRRVVLGDPRGRLHHLGERPVHEPLAERERSPGEHGGALEPGEELARETALPDPRLAEDRDELRAPVADDSGVGVLKELELLFASDVRRGDAERPAGLAVGADHAPHRHVVRETLEHARSGRAPRRPPRASARAPSAPSGSRQGAADCWSRAATFSASPVANVESPDSATTSPDSIPMRTAEAAVAALEDRGGGAYGTLRVVLVRRRDAEDRHDRIAGELLDRPAVRGDVSCGALEEARHPPPDDLRIASGDERGRVDEVDEQRRRELPLHQPGV